MLHVDVTESVRHIGDVVVDLILDGVQNGARDLTMHVGPGSK